MVNCLFPLRLKEKQQLLLIKDGYFAGLDRYRHIILISQVNIIFEFFFENFTVSQKRRQKQSLAKSAISAEKNLRFKLE